MNQQIQVVIQDDESVFINGTPYQEGDGMAAVLRQQRSGQADAILVVEAASATYFRAIGKVIYAAVFAGFLPDDIHIMVEGKRIERDDN
jgi:biopolymer transport protein ExbD